MKDNPEPITSTSKGKEPMHKSSTEDSSSREPTLPNHVHELEDQAEVTDGSSKRMN